MFVPHEELVEPPGEALVWRYMDLARFVSLLDTSALFFAKAADMVDTWEGSLGSFADWIPGDVARHSMQSNREKIYLNCWHVSKFESAAMWDIYQREGRGVAVQTTWGELTASLNSPWTINGGKVTYLDPDADVEVDTVLGPFMFKRKSFEHEKEARLVIWANGAGGPDEHRGRAPGIDGEFFYTDESTSRPGYLVEVDLGRLIKKVYVSPDDPKWIEEAVAAVVTRFGHTFPVQRSDLYGNPFSQPLR